MFRYVNVLSNLIWNYREDLCPASLSSLDRTNVLTCIKKNDIVCVRICDDYVPNVLYVDCLGRLFVGRVWRKFNVAQIF